MRRLAVYVSGRRRTPSGTTPVVTSRQRAISSLRASATIMVLRVAAGILGALPVPGGQSAVLLEHQEAPRQLDHAPANPRVAGPGEPLLPPPAAALVRRAG